MDRQRDDHKGMLEEAYAEDARREEAARPAARDAWGQVWAGSARSVSEAFNAGRYLLALRRANALIADQRTEEAAEDQVKAWFRRHAELGTDASLAAYAMLVYRNADHAEALADDAARSWDPERGASAPDANRHGSQTPGIVSTCTACGSDDIEHEPYGVRCLDCGNVDEIDA